MIFIRQTVAVLSCAVLFGLGFASVTPAEDGLVTAADQSDRRQGNPDPSEQQSPAKMQNDQLTSEAQAQPQGSKVIKGQVDRVDGDFWFIKDERGKEVKVHVDQTTRRSPQKPDDANVKGVKGIFISAMVNEQNHALSISSPDRRDDRHDHSTDGAEEKR